MHERKRSAGANAYFHVLANKIAGVVNLSLDEAKKELVLNYGTILTYGNGEIISLKLPMDTGMDKIYPYAKNYGICTENGVMMDCYILFKRTSDLTSAEFKKLLDGAIFEARELGIETKTPDEIANMMALWENEGEMQ